MKRKHSEAAHAKRRLQDAYIEGLSDDEQALEALEWHDEFAPPYEASRPSQQLTEELPF